MATLPELPLSRFPSARTPAKSAPAELHLRRARALEAAGERAQALEAYEAALRVDPGDAEALADLARLALTMDMAAVSLALWERLGEQAPARLDAIDGRAEALAALGRAEEAVAVLKAAILSHPHAAPLWNRLGLILDRQGESETALVFFEEAIRLAPALASALYNRGNVRFDLGELARAEADYDAAARCAASPADAAKIALARALLSLHRGDLAQGWDAYTVRNHADHPLGPVFDAPGDRWTPEMKLAGAHLLLIGEQGVGDEAMFASVLPDAIAAVGQHGRLSLAVEPRLVPLMARSFPHAEVFAYTAAREAGRVVRRVTGEQAASVDAWAPLADLCRRFRRDVSSFPRAAYLTPDPVRVAHWRAWLGDGPPAVGLSWRSGKLAGGRGRQYPPLAAWAPLLRTDGVRFVDLQYGETAEERAELGRLAGVPLLVPPDIDLRADLDDLAALACALDRLVSVPNATAMLAGGTGAKLLLLTGPAAWPQLGGDSYPWFASTSCFTAAKYGEWGPVMREVAKREAQPTQLSAGQAG